MKRITLLFVALFLSYAVDAQVKVFHENFELSGNGADSVTASGATNNWSLNSRLFHGGARCDSNIVSINDTAYLTTNQFSTATYPYVVLKFSHICKVEILDAGEIEISVNNGPWTKLTSAQYINPGNSQFVSIGNKFNANAYPLDWSPTLDFVKPTQSWWKNEVFDISALAGNSSNVRIRFLLRDNNGNGTNYNYGWYIDDIEVTAATNELIPPKITMLAPIINDTINVTGPFEVNAWITDNSGIDTAYIIYKVNNGANQYVPMVWISDSTYRGIIPSYTYTNKINYVVHAIDNSTGHNQNDGIPYWFYIKKIVPVVEIGAGTTQQGWPYATLYDDAKTQMLYTAAEISAADGIAGPITAISFNLASASTIPMNGFTIQMQHTSLSTLTGFVNAGWTTVYSGTYTVTNVGWMSIPLQTPFNWNGTGNILINICYDNSTNSANSPVYCTSVAGKTWTQSLNSGTGCTLAAGSVQTYRPNIRLAMPTTVITKDAGVTEIITPEGTILSGVNNPVVLRIKNYAQDTLKKVHIAWKLDGVSQTPYIWTGLIPEQVTSQPITIGTVNVVPGSHTIKVWTELPNDGTDQIAENDTLTVNFYACSSLLNGTYTIGSGGDYPSFASALSSLMNCGISGPVTFNVISGTYTEQLTIPEISGVTGSNSITFQSASGNYADVTLRYTANGTSDNYVVMLNGADNISFRNMTMQALGTSYANVININNNSTYNSFVGNRLVGVATSNVSANLAVIYSPGSSATCDSVNTFDGNIIENGSFGIYLFGQGSLANQLENKHVIKNNQFINQYYMGIYLYYQNAPQIVSNKIITNSVYGSYYAIYCAYCDNQLMIKKNKISISNGGIGIYTYYCDGASGKEALIVNNMVALSGSNAAYGIYPSYCSYQKIFYNSVNISAANATSRGFYLTGSTGNGNHYIKNNIFSYSGNNSGGLAIYISNTTGVSAMNYNDLFSTGTNLGYWTALQANLPAWKTASTKDSNSVSVNPYFVSTSDLHTYSPEINGKAVSLSDVSDDIDGHPRNLTTPDIGASEFDVPQNNIGLIEISQPVNSCGAMASSNVTVRLKNFGTTQIATADVYYTLNNGIPVHEVMIHTILPDSAYSYTFTQQADMTVAGNYTFKVWANLAGDTIHLNDTINNYTVYSGYNFNLGSYTMGFEPSEFIGDWTTLDANADTYGWSLPYNSAADAHSGTNSSRLYNANVNPGNDWLFSRCFTLNAGSTYKIEFWYKAYDASYPQNIDLKVGSAPVPASMTTSLTVLNSFSNTAYQKATVYFVPSATGSYYFGWWGHSVANSYYAFVDDINISFVPLQEATLLSIENPVSGCGLSTSEPVSIKIKNTGANNINGNFNAYYKFNNGSIVSQAVTSVIAPNDTLQFSFTQTVDAHVVANDSIFPIKVWISLLNDPFQFNDTLNKVVASSHVPADPVAISDTAVFGGPATLQAVSAVTVYWFDVPLGGTIISSGSSFTTPDLFVNTVYYAQSITPGGTTTWTFDTDIEGWTVQNPCSSTDNWAWSSDGGAGTLFAVDPYGGSYQLATSPSVMVAGATTVSLSFDHRYITESCCDEGYVAYKLDNGPWTQFNPDVNTYNVSHYIDNDPLNSCVSTTKSSFAGTQATYITSSGSISTGGASNIQLAFVFTSDGSVAGTGWFIDEVTLSGGMGGCQSNRVPDTAHVALNPYDASVVSVISPVQGCSDGSENITVRIRNNGLNTINGNITGGYKVNGAAPVTQSISNIILPGDTASFTFATPFITGLSQTNQDSVYDITSYVVLSGDTYSLNDTAEASMTLLYTPPAPVANNVTIPYATQAVLHAISNDSIHWYELASGGTPLASTSTYTTPLLFNTSVYYADAFSTGGASYWTFNANLEGWTSTASCGYASTWVWATDGGAGAVYAQDVSTTSSQVLKSPSINLSGANSVTLKYRHRYSTESCCDHGYVLYKLNDNAWTPFVLTTGAYSGSYSIGYEPLINSCSSATLSAYSGAATTYQTHSGMINTAGADSMRIAFVFTTDGSVAGDGWYIDSVLVKGSGSGCASVRVPDTVFVTGVPACDMSVLDIYEPNSAIELTNSELITVKVKNYGTAPANNVPISYSINGGSPVTEMITGPIPSNDTALYTFATPANLAVLGTYTISVFTSLLCDTTAINDTASKTIVNSPIPYCVSNSQYLYENIGNVTFGTLNNGNALPVLGNTTATNYYTDFTTLPQTPVTVGANYQFSVSQIENYTTFYSTAVKVYIDYNRNGTFDVPNELAFSGVTTSALDPTVTGTITIPVTGVVTGMFTRMRVVMDRAGAANPCGTYSYGETEDYFLFISPQIPHDAGVVEIIQPGALETEAEALPVKVIVRNFGTDTIRNTSNMLVAYSHNGQAAQSAIWSGGDILPLQSDTIVLPDLVVSPNMNNICAYTQLAGDSNTFNDTYCKNFNGTPLHDAGIVAFLDPGTESVSGSSATVKVIMRNFGADDLTSLNLVYELNGVLQATQPWTGTLLPNSDDTVTFTQTFTVPQGNFAICAYTSFASDSNNINDSLCMNSYGVFTSNLPYYDNFDEGIVNWSVVSAAGSLWELGQPSYGTTNTAYSPINSWDINLSEPYGNSANSMLYTQNFNFSSSLDMRLRFWFNLNSESSYDGFRIEYTIDTGSTWNVLGTVSDPLASNWYNSASLYSSSKPGWTGNTTVWRSCYYKLTVLNNVPVVRFRFVFSSDPSVNGTGLSIDNFAIYRPTNKDVGVEAISSPKVQAIAGTSSQVKVRIRNNGLATQQNIPVSYKINPNGTVITQNWSGALLPNDSIMFTFTTPFTVPAGDFTIYAFTGLSGDGENLNDTSHAHIKGVPKYFVPYSDSLEGTNYWVSSGTPNLWEYGAPSSTTINTAHSPLHAWKTNIDGNYINNATSYLYSPWFNFTSVDSAYLEFWHWYHTQNANDYGQIEYTVNNGTSWLVLGSQNDAQAVNWYNTSISGVPCWSGNSSGYVYSRYRLTSISAIMNSSGARFRYKFYSNTSVCNYDGWAIDDFAITAPPIPKDAGIFAIHHPTTGVQTGSQVTVKVVIKNYGTDSLRKVPVRYFIPGGAVVVENWYGVLYPGDTTSYTFTAPYTSPGSTYQFCAFTKRIGDTYWANDTLCTSITASPAPNDLGISKILEPGSYTLPGDTVTVKVRIRNYGTLPQSNISVVYLRNFVQAGAGIYAGPLAAGDSVDYTFSTIFISPTGNYNVCAKTVLTGDADPANDQVCIYPIGSGIENYDYSDFILLQNIPNPTTDHTAILFYVPADKRCRFEMTDIMGQMIRSEEFDAVRGENRIDINVADLSSGIYFYSVAYSGKKLTKRMAVIK